MLIQIPLKFVPAITEIFIWGELVLLLTESIEIAQKVGFAYLPQILTIDDLVFTFVEPKVSKVIIEPSIEGRFFFEAVANVK